MIHRDDREAESGYGSFPEYREHRPGRSGAAPPAAELENVGVRFGNIQVLDGISLSIGRGEIVALLGDNGAGKSTIAKTLSGLCDFQRGSVYLHGKRYGTLSPAIAEEHGIVSIQQEIPFAGDLSIVKYFFLGRERLLSPYLPLLDVRKMKRLIRNYFDELEFDFRKRPGDMVSSLTKGERQILEIARAYYFHRSLIIMDESTSSLSQNEYARAMSLMEDVKQRGGSVLFIDHKVQDIYAYADSFLVLYGGRNLIKIEKNEVSTRELEKMLISSHLSTVKEMAAGITHQIRNPLAIMKVTAQMAKEDFKVQSRQKEFEEKIEAVIRNIDIIDLYVHSFFNFTHEQDSYYKKCKVRNVITEAVNKIPGHVVGERVILRDILDQEMEYPMIRSNVVQVLINLLINVIEFSEPEGTIRIEAYVRNHLHIQFTYRGKIMPHGFESGLYAPLFLHEQNTAGLGVTLFHHMFQQHKCTIEVGSKDGSAKYLELIL